MKHEHEHRTDTFVTYEVWEPSRSAPERVLKTETKKVTVPGEIRGWRVGTFNSDEGRSRHGVKIIYGEPKSSELIEVPDEAVNVQIHVGVLPKRFRRSH